MIYIQIVDKQIITATGLRELLTAHLPAVYIVLSVNIDGVHQNRSEKVPDLILAGMDDRISNIENISCVIQITKRFPVSPIIVYGDFGNLLMIRDLFKIGITGFFLRADSENQLIECVLSALRRQNFISPKAALSILDYFERSPGPQRIDKKNLSRRELEVARCLNKGMRTKEIAISMAVKPPTISAAKSRLFRKLNVHSVSEFRLILGYL